MRRKIVGLAVALGFGVATIATGAMAAPPRGGGHVGGMGGHVGGHVGAMGGHVGAMGAARLGGARLGGVGHAGPSAAFAGRSAAMAPRAGHPGGGHFAFRGGHHHGWGGGFGGLYAFGGWPYYGDGDCYQLRRVLTPYGWRWRRFWVCD